MASIQTPEALAKKVGPLPVWGWAALILVGYFLYNKLHSSPSTTGANANGTAQTDNGSSTYVPGFDAASGSRYGTPSSGTINNYYYGDSNANNANGGGTSNGGGNNNQGGGGNNNQGGGTSSGGNNNQGNTGLNGGGGGLNNGGDSGRGGGNHSGGNA